MTFKEAFKLAMTDKRFKSYFDYAHAEDCKRNESVGSIQFSIGDEAFYYGDDGYWDDETNKWVHVFVGGKYSYKRAQYLIENGYAWKIDTSNDVRVLKTMCRGV